MRKSTVIDRLVESMRNTEIKLATLNIAYYKELLSDAKKSSIPNYGLEYIPIIEDLKGKLDKLKTSK